MVPTTYTVLGGFDSQSVISLPSVLSTRNAWNPISRLGVKMCIIQPRSLGIPSGCPGRPLRMKSSLLMLALMVAITVVLPSTL